MPKPRSVLPQDPLPNSEISLTWDKETESFDAKPNEVTKTFTVVGTITYAVKDTTVSFDASFGWSF